MYKVHMLSKSCGLHGSNRLVHVMSYLFAVNFILLWFICTVIKVASHICSDDQYQDLGHNGQQRCIPCTKCPEGYTIHVPCNKYSDTVCCKLQKGVYKMEEHSSKNSKDDSKSQIIITKRSNNSSRTTQCERNEFYSPSMAVCVPCTKCQKGLYIERACSTTTDTVCRPCQRGYYADIENLTKCRKCQDCSPGNYVSKVCSRIRDTICRPCSKQHFTDVSNTQYYCQPCSRCSEGQAVLRPCSSTQNVQCGACDPGYFMVERSSECVQCAECKEDAADNSSTIVEECRKTSKDKRRICAPEIVKQHQRLLQVGVLKIPNITTKPYHSYLNEIMIGAASEKQPSLSTLDSIGIAISSMALLCVVSLVVLMFRGRKMRKTQYAIPSEMGPETIIHSHEIRPPPSDINDNDYSYENRITIQDTAPIIHYSSVPNNINRCEISSSDKTASSRSLRYDPDPLDKIDAKDHYIRLRQTSDDNITMSGIFSVSQVGESKDTGTV